MKNDYYIMSWLIVLISLFSCGPHLPEADSDVCGIMIVDGENYYEAQMGHMYSSGIYGGLELRHDFNADDPNCTLYYGPRCFINRSTSQQTNLQLRFKCSESTIQDGHYSFSGKAEGDTLIGLTIGEEWYNDFVSFELVLVDMQVCATQLKYELFRLRIEYSIDYYDDDGCSHHVEGWAIPHEGRDI